MGLAYLTWLVVVLIIPTAILWAFNFHILKKYMRTLTLGISAALVIAVPWDLWAIAMGVWTFPPDGVSGLTILGLPLEEHLFIILFTLQVATLTLILKYRSHHASR